MLSYLAPILVFGLVIFVHELGHFLAAKALGVYAPRFSIGFGPALVKFRRGETEYVLAALPLGGYVRMASRLDEESAFLEGGSEEKSVATEPAEWADPEAMIPFGPKPVPADRWFESKSLPARIVIMIAGVTMNVLLAFVVYTALVLQMGRPVVPTTVIGSVGQLAQVPQLRQLQIGDTIRAINNAPVTTWNEVQERVSGSTGTVSIRTNRDSVTIPLDGVTTAAAVYGVLDFFVPAVIDSVVAGMPAVAAGFQSGDSVVSIDGQPVAAWSELTRLVGAAAGRPLLFIVGRSDGMHSITVTPEPRPEDPATGKLDTVGKIGAAKRSVATREPVTVVEGIRGGASHTWDAAGGVVKIVHALFTGGVSVSQLGGPIAITRMSVSEAKKGLEDLFNLIAFLSVNIAVLNLLPIPILDGGQILLNVIESAKGSPFSMRTREYILRVGLLAIGLLFVTVMFNDTKGWLMQLYTWVSHSLGRA